MIETPAPTTSPSTYPYGVAFRAFACRHWNEGMIETANSVYVTNIVLRFINCTQESVVLKSKLASARTFKFTIALVFVGKKKIVDFDQVV